MTHTSTLMEVHRITLPVGATGDNVAVARLHAEAYARARGFEIRAGSFNVVQERGKLPTVRNLVGVEFEVVVGKGTIALDQRQPGTLDAWTWSAPAVAWWRAIFNRRDGRQGRVLARREDGVASVTALPGVLGSAWGDPTREPGYVVPPIPSASGLSVGGMIGRDDPRWRGPDALAGPQAGTGDMPPWMDRMFNGGDDYATNDDR